MLTLPPLDWVFFLQASWSAALDPLLHSSSMFPGDPLRPVTAILIFVIQIPTVGCITIKGLDLDSRYPHLFHFIPSFYQISIHHSHLWPLRLHTSITNPGRVYGPWPKTRRWHLISIKYELSSFWMISMVNPVRVHTSPRDWYQNDASGISKWPRLYPFTFGIQGQHLHIQIRFCQSHLNWWPFLL